MRARELGHGHAGLQLIQFGVAPRACARVGTSAMESQWTCECGRTSCVRASWDLNLCAIAHIFDVAPRACARVGTQIDEIGRFLETLSHLVRARELGRRTGSRHRSQPGRTSCVRASWDSTAMGNKAMLLVAPRACARVGTRLTSIASPPMRKKPPPCVWMSLTGSGAKNRLTASTLAAVRHRSRLMSHATENVRQWAAQDAGHKTPRCSNESHRATAAHVRLTGGVRSWWMRWEAARKRLPGNTEQLLILQFNAPN